MITYAVYKGPMARDCIVDDVIDTVLYLLLFVRDTEDAVKADVVDNDEAVNATKAAIDVNFIVYFVK